MDNLRLSWRELAGLPTVARSKGGKAHLRGEAATEGNLRLNHERRLVDQTGASWNQIASWLRQVDGLRRPA